MNREETLRLEAYLREKFNPGLRLVARDRAEDSVEVFLGAEFIAVIYKDVDEGETAYQFQMSILQEDIFGA